MIMIAAAIVIGRFGVSPVLSGSMRPAIPPGAAIITHPVQVSSVRPGDIVVFRPPGQSVAYAHRIVTVTGRPGSPVITTKGDANPVPDAWHARLAGPTVRRVVAVIPQLGRLMVAVRSRPARAVLIGVIGLLLTAVGARRIAGPSRRERPTARTARPLTTARSEETA